MESQTIIPEKEFFPGKLMNYTQHSDFIELESKRDVLLRIYFVTDEILRFRYANDGYFGPDFSYAIDEKYIPTNPTPELEELESTLIIKTKAIHCHVDKETLKIKICDPSGRVINEDEKGYHWEANENHGGYIVQNSKVAQPHECFYGLGDKPTDLNLDGKRFVNWGTDEYGYHKDTDPLYKNIPIYYGLHNNIAYGIFFDNTYRAYFDFQKERDNTTSFWAQGGEMNYYFIAGPQLLDVCKRYTKLTGTPEMPPMWALGFQQCKWSYYPESNVKEVTNKMRELRIPCDAIYLDIDYMDGFRCFTWDKEKFPDPKRMVDELAADGFKTMVIIDPGIKKDKNYDVFQEGLANDYFCKRIDGPYIEGKVWPGACYFPDFTKPEVREWWAGLYKGLIEDVGVAGVWNDMNEPALFEVENKTFPNDVLHDYDGHQTGHRKAHNIYGMQMARATAEGVKRFSNGKRSLIITRSGYSGLQRYSSVWTGDNIATWEHLWLAGVQTQRLAISGISFAGSDIGGFINQPSAELMIRWIQLGIFHPFCRVHSSGDHGDQEPWSFGEECVVQFRKAVELRYQLLPYIYTSFYQYHTSGAPMIRPLVFEDQGTSETYNRDFEFMCGEHLLVTPVVKEKAKSIKMYFPQGNWYHYYSGKKFAGRKEQVVDTPIDHTPLFVKEGAVIPHYPIQQYVGEKEIDTISLRIYYKNGALQSQLFEDERDGYGYENGLYNLSTFSLTGDANSLHIIHEQSGDYRPKVEFYKIELIGIPFDIREIQVDNNVIQEETDNIIINANFKELHIS